MSLDYIKYKWEELGRRDPLWSVLTWEDKKDMQWDRNSFYHTGEVEIDKLFLDIENLPSKLQFDEALDFGCGVGRLTFPLTKKFNRVIGVDIASAMIDYAKAANNQRASFLVNNRADLKIFADNKFDFVLSLITLQHLPTSLVKKYIKEFIRVVKPGGLVVFEMPDHPLTRWRLKKILARKSNINSNNFCLIPGCLNTKPNKKTTLYI